MWKPGRREQPDDVAARAEGQHAALQERGEGRRRRGAQLDADHQSAAAHLTDPAAALRAQPLQGVGSQAGRPLGEAFLSQGAQDVARRGAGQGRVGDDVAPKTVGDDDKFILEIIFRINGNLLCK